MKSAPERALYVWPQRSSMSYAVALATKLGRTDLEITAAHIFDDGARRLLGRRLSGIVLDHATNLTDRQWFAYEKIRDVVTAQQPKVSDHQS